MLRRAPRPPGRGNPARPRPPRSPPPPRGDRVYPTWSQSGDPRTDGGFFGPIDTLLGLLGRLIERADEQIAQTGELIRRVEELLTLNTTAAGGDGGDPDGLHDRIDSVENHPQRWLDTNQVAAILGKAPYTVRGYCRKRQCHHGKEQESGKFWVRRDEVVRLLKLKQPPPEGSGERTVFNWNPNYSESGYVEAPAGAVGRNGFRG